MPVLLELQEAGDDGAQRGADPYHGREERHGIRALEGAPDVGQHARRVAQGRRDEGPREESTDEEAAKVGGEGAQEVEGNVYGEGDVKDPSSTVQLAQGGEEERAGAVPQEKEGDCEGSRLC